MLREPLPAGPVDATVTVTVAARASTALLRDLDFLSSSVTVGQEEVYNVPGWPDPRREIIVVYGELCNSLSPMTSRCSRAGREWPKDYFTFSTATRAPPTSAITCVDAGAVTAIVVVL